MTTSPPPPPPSEWPESGAGSGGTPPPGGRPAPPAPPSQPAQSTQSTQSTASPQSTQSRQPVRSPGSSGRQSWWSTGRVIGAIVIVLVLMGGSATAGFLAGAAWSGVESAVDVAGDFSGDGDGPTTEGGSLAVGETVEGSLGDGEVEHELTVDSSTQVTIELRSDDFDTVLTVLDAGGTEVAYNDDIDFGENRNSRVEVMLEPGTYSLLVDAFGFDDGNYELSVS